MTKYFFYIWIRWYWRIFINWLIYFPWEKMELTLSHFFDKKFVKATFLSKKLLKSWIDEIFFRWEWISRFSTLWCTCLKLKAPYSVYGSFDEIEFEVCNDNIEISVCNRVGCERDFIRFAKSKPAISRIDRFCRNSK